ncbi:MULTISPECIES: benzoate/H(+) symporter BenE family transporter [Ochrobactrum]|jgi:benzoate membrane transport protein|uniref:Benzoate transporter family protein n=1 Tax=Ochrobactrum quorumnocens TaxID=271865 RepID=A0A248UHN3_9HYPH|nr:MULTISPECIES: benzoate/H(+) symporter BenE family transporter [Brucella/Ochrobactrum group]ASV86343.1 benzoate transporter family protein [[Ochrobactrum] quorumnocens]KAA9369354.1 benzoate/H(+) symporter BenE family transporter [[Ochrobactrum] quorumnocens]MBD7991262.1 benzoate/H(+) symporter BenE family transporter [Ochrobactrum gallinarum]MDH7790224.1 benzoate membrane transport protein [Ochrobactrum sp. AN78]
MRFSVFASSAVAAIVGFGSTLALIIAAANALGATQAQTASWVTAVCLAIAASSAWLSVRYKMPIIGAWSTPGLALIGASVGFTMPEAVGAFIVAAIALILTGLIRQLSTLVSRIPTSVASGMLAGVLLSFVIAAAKTVSLDPAFVLPLVALFFVIRLFNPSLAVIAVLVIGMTYALLSGRAPQLPAPEISTLTLIWPEFHMGAIIALALPLYIVTMASQNLPGFAVLRASGYEPPTSASLQVTGLFSLLSAPFGAGTSNLAAISAALCTGPDAHPDHAKRWLTGPVYAAIYVVFALFGASLVAIFAVLPTTLIALVAGLALTGPFINAMSLALKHEEERLAAVITFAVTASGIAFFGVGSAFWALLAGLGVAVLEHLRKKISR